MAEALVTERIIPNGEVLAARLLELPDAFNYGQRKPVKFCESVWYYPDYLSREPDPLLIDGRDFHGPTRDPYDQIQWTKLYNNLVYHLTGANSSPSLKKAIINKSTAPPPFIGRSFCFAFDAQMLFEIAPLLESGQERIPGIGLEGVRLLKDLLFDDPDLMF